MKRSGSAIWQGDLQSGRGQVSTESGILEDARYGFASRFEDGPGTNPEELIGAAHAGCFSMALSMILGQQDMVPDKIETRADVSIEQDGEGFSITKIHLDVEATIPGADEEAFRKAADAAKGGCPVSKLVKADITMDARLGG